MKTRSCTARNLADDAGAHGVPGVAHGFAMADLPVYDRDASERHFEQTLALWRRNVSPEVARR